MPYEIGDIVKNTWVYGSEPHHVETRYFLVTGFDVIDINGARHYTIYDMDRDEYSTSYLDTMDKNYRYELHA